MFDHSSVDYLKSIVHGWCYFLIRYSYHSNWLLAGEQFIQVITVYKVTPFFKFTPLTCFHSHSHISHILYFSCTPALFFKAFPIKISYIMYLFSLYLCINLLSCSRTLSFTFLWSVLRIQVIYVPFCHVYLLV